jgi:ABC-type transport system involved in multi-copper enzyme maturation permease subunit
MGKLFAIAKNTFKESVRQPIFWLLVLASAGLVVITRMLPLFTFEEDVKMVKDIGLATLTLCGLLVGLFASSVVITEEIERLTVMTVLSKPVSRVQFVLGKFLGVILAALVAMVIVGLVFFWMLWWQLGEGISWELLTPEETSARTAERLTALGSVLSGTVLCYLEVVVLCAVSVAIATRLSTVVNISVCLSIFMLGNMTAWLATRAAAAEKGGALVKGLVAVISTIMPYLQTYNVQAVALGRPMPLAYVGWSLVYTLLYVTAALCFAVMLFRGREVY